MRHCFDLTLQARWVGDDTHVQPDELRADGLAGQLNGVNRSIGSQVDRVEPLRLQDRGGAERGEDVGIASRGATHCRGCIVRAGGDEHAQLADGGDGNLGCAVLPKDAVLLVMPELANTLQRVAQGAIWAGHKTLPLKSTAPPGLIVT